MAHLHAILASESPSAILIKRGPGKQTCTIGWERRTDSFKVGQWLRKEIDPTATDLSPDGKHFAYHVNDHSWSRQNHVYRAISHAPWLKALTFWGAAPRTFGPGVGLFFKDKDGKIRLRAIPYAPDWDHLGIEVVPDFPDTKRWKSMAKDSIFFIRLQRDGWLAVTPWEKCSELEAAGIAKSSTRPRPHRIIFEKALPFGWTLRQTYWCGSHKVVNRGTSWQTFALVSPTGELEAHPSWEWADVDSVRNRVVWTEDCVLYGAGKLAAGLGPAKELLDTREMSFERRIAPY